MYLGSNSVSASSGLMGSPQICRRSLAGSAQKDARDAVLAKCGQRAGSPIIRASAVRAIMFCDRLLLHQIKASRANEPLQIPIVVKMLHSTAHVVNIAH